MPDKIKSYESVDRDECHKDKDDCHKKDPCPLKPGTILRIFIPAGAVINLLNIIELSSPGGVCIIVRIPLLKGSWGGILSTIINSVKEAGGTIDFVDK